ncbi:hypothetical protein [Agrobacterium sp. ST15.13.015]|uniref:hypothetical protein n=1 Tax=Agrobacterium sp. ST15.13.015 TaxID=3017319 RepID=UPI0022C6D163|nr:hypothetical protein [Agrobacterium sp. ST15.13.015]MCZ7502760.1 hypothetical protein [Rhizobium rhizogenes]
MSQSKPLHRWTPVVYGFLTIVIGVAAAWKGTDLIHANEKARDIIVTVFSILAGFLIAIMTLLGDQSNLPGSWKIAKTKSDAIKAKLIRQKWLFYCYLLTLSLIFMHALVAPKYPCIAPWIERLYFGFATSSFLFSFTLPSTLMSVQADRIDAVIEARRNAASKLEKN